MGGVVGKEGKVLLGKKGEVLLEKEGEVLLEKEYVVGERERERGVIGDLKRKLQVLSGRSETTR